MRPEQLSSIFTARRVCRSARGFPKAEGQVRPLGRALPPECEGLHAELLTPRTRFDSGGRLYA